MAKYGMSTSVEGNFDDVKEKIIAALKIQGFGILTEINIQKVLKEKINADYEPYLILGACNPKFANQALSTDRSIGLLLPCNVVIRQDGSRVEVSIQDPEVMFSMVDIRANSELEKLPSIAKALLQTALSSL